MHSSRVAAEARAARSHRRPDGRCSRSCSRTHAQHASCHAPPPPGAVSRIHDGAARAVDADSNACRALHARGRRGQPGERVGRGWGMAGSVRRQRARATAAARRVPLPTEQQTSAHDGPVAAVRCYPRRARPLEATPAGLAPHRPPGRARRLPRARRPARLHTRHPRRRLPQLQAILASSAQSDSLFFS